ncbi:MAG: divergent polysaccharide deacetylase family protein [Rhodovibrionaceae bacterium]
MKSAWRGIQGQLREDRKAGVHRLTALLGSLTNRRRALSLAGLIAGSLALGFMLGSAISLWTEPKTAERMALLPLETPAAVQPETRQEAAPAVRDPVELAMSPPLAARRIPVAVETLPPPVPPAAADLRSGEEALAGRSEAAPALIINGPEAASSAPKSPQLTLRSAPSASVPSAEQGQAETPRQEADQPPAWQRNAVQLATLPKGPAIAIVIDDVGLNRPGADRSVALPAPVTLALMTYAEGLESLAARARAAGHELMVHLPMQPIDAEYDAGINVLTVGLPRAELLQRLSWGLERFDGYVGINNHMGSRFTTDSDGMAAVMAELKRRGLMFLDSKTVGNSLGVAAARSAGVPVVARDIFLDHEQAPDFIAAQLRALEDLARQRGYAIGIGHPHGITLQALESWIPQARARGIDFVPISAVLGLQERHLAAHARGNSG